MKRQFKRKIRKHKKKSRTVRGRISVTKSGFGFLTPEDDLDGRNDDIFISRSNLNSAMNGDIVKVEMMDQKYSSRGPEGCVKEILERAFTKSVGIYFDCDRFGIVSPMGKNGVDIYIQKKNAGKARQGDYVEVSITKYPKGGRGPEGRVLSVIANDKEPGGDIKAILREYDVNVDFPLATADEAKNVSAPGYIDDRILREELKRRTDLRDLEIITIDGPHSKDLDDAISIKKITNGYRLGVHIADVSHYVKEGGAMDDEAFQRGNSIYLLDQVVPMLPSELSNGICSLNEGVDRLTLSCIMDINHKGEIIDHRIEETVINSKGRLVYDDVSDLLEGKIDETQEFKEDSENKSIGPGNIREAKKDVHRKNHLKAVEHKKMLKTMEELAILLEKKRQEDGSLDFDLDEAEIHVDKNGIPQEIVNLDRRIANRMIEEFMLAANRTVAEEYFWMNYPFVYRIHEKPDTENIMKLKTFMAGIGIKMSLNADNIHSKVLAQILKDLEGDVRLPMVSSVMLRSMQKARYSPECSGHYGLAFKFYCHFTSPIRRYPDLLIHRIIKEHINKTATSERLSHYAEIVQEASEQSSNTEIRAQKMERQIEKIKKAQFMEAHVGEEFSGVISGVTSFGFYVQLENTVEGLVHVSTLDDNYDFEEGKFKLMGRSDGREFNLGDFVKVRVAKADKFTGHIDFQLVS
ncbi:MAG: RNB domain-containing ribonuclease [Clostridiales bacterium]|nr:RNB domain-containing ribonuclease [Clostridiales bacterium]MDY4061160.1 RNB domain-containing ribonuclease [Anaerovoracaceae bacterium]